MSADSAGDSDDDDDLRVRPWKGKERAYYYGDDSSPTTPLSTTTSWRHPQSQPQPQPLCDARRSPSVTSTASTFSTASTLSTLGAQQSASYVHVVRATDTLPGLALQFGVKVEDIKRANKLLANDSIHLRRTLVVPIAADSLHVPQPSLPPPSTHPLTPVSPAVPATAATGMPEYAEYLRKVDAQVGMIKALLPPPPSPTPRVPRAAADAAPPASKRGLLALSASWLSSVKK